jgi:hypothetical protein
MITTTATAATPNFVLPSCSNTAGTRKNAEAQFWQHCLTCNLDACIACIAVCHHGHDLQTTQYGGPFSASIICACAAQGKCSDALYKQAELVKKLGPLERERNEMRRQAKLVEEASKSNLALEKEVIAYTSQDAALREEVKRKMSVNAGTSVPQLQEVMERFQRHLALHADMQTKGKQLIGVEKARREWTQLKEKLDGVERERAKVLSAIEKL